MKNNLIIGGVHKAGTTSLFTYLMDHPSICGSLKKEIHYFTPLRYGKSVENIADYNNYFSHCNPDIDYLLEASPSYLYGKNLICDKIFSELNEPKIIFILRDPVSRFISYFKHCEGKFLIPRNTSFKTFYEQNLKNLELDDSDDPFFRGLREGLYVDYLKYWIDNYGENVKIIFFEDLINSPNHSITSICNWLKIDSNYYLDYNFKTENKTSRYDNKTIHKISSSINRKFEYFFRKNRQVKTFFKKIYSYINTTKEITLDEETTAKATDFYRLKNKELEVYLTKNGYQNYPKWITNN